MALILSDLFWQTQSTFMLTLAAGEAGLNRKVTWVHTIEDSKTVNFRRSGDLMITTGLTYGGEAWLKSLIQALHSRGCCGLIINEGKYIKQEDLTGEVVRLCDKLCFPLFTMPWKVDVADVLQNYCDRLLREAHRDDGITKALSRLLFHGSEGDQALAELKEYGYRMDGSYCVAVAEVDLAHSHLEKVNRTMALFEEMLQSCSLKAHLFLHGGSLVLVLSHPAADAFRSFRQRCREEGLRVGFGIQVERLREIAVSYSYACFSFSLAGKDSSGETAFAEDVYRLCFSCGNQELLHEIRQTYLGVIYDCDSKNHTELLQTLRQYLACDGNVQQVAARMFIHRNTVNFRIRKIRELTGCRLGTLDEKLRYQLALCISDYLDAYGSE